MAQRALKRYKMSRDIALAQTKTRRITVGAVMPPGSSETNCNCSQYRSSSLLFADQGLLLDQSPVRFLCRALALSAVGRLRYRLVPLEADRHVMDCFLSWARGSRRVGGSRPRRRADADARTSRGLLPCRESHLYSRRAGRSSLSTGRGLLPC